MTPPRQPDVLDLFAGPGGWSEGLRQLGLADIGIEWDAAACQTRAAAGHHTVRADVARLATAPMRNCIRHLTASPPCQAWSAAGKRHGEVDRPLVEQAIADLAAGRDPRSTLLAACADPRSLLAAEPMRWIRDLRPETIALEEVPAVLPLWGLYAQVLRGWGYSVWHGVLNAADHGLPQTRRRAVLMASLVRETAPPEPTHAQAPAAASLFDEPLPAWVTMADALGWPAGMDVVTRGARKTPGGNAFSADRPSWALTEKARSWVLVNRRDSPAWVAAHGPRRNRPMTEPAPTLTGEAHRWYWSDGDDRHRLTVAEASVLQGFRPDYPWQGRRTPTFLQIGNAVPPPLATAVLAGLYGLPLPSVLAPAAVAA